MIERRHSTASRATSPRSMADPAAGAVGGVVDSTREFAAQALERAAEKMRDLRYGMSDSAQAAQRQMHRCAGATSRYIAQRPLQAALIAAGIGALVMAIVIASRRRGNRY